ncbi:MAG: hypothetical protein ACRDNZ_20455 [Streptosporangiaceae bacterium]
MGILRPGFGLGTVWLVPADQPLSVTSMVAHHGHASRASPAAIRYDALAWWLARLAGQIGRHLMIARACAAISTLRTPYVIPYMDEEDQRLSR